VLIFQLQLGRFTREIFKGLNGGLVRSHGVSSNPGRDVISIKLYSLADIDIAFRVEVDG
jgi:hypothetical protein